MKFLNCEDCYVYIQPKGLLIFWLKEASKKMNIVIQYDQPFIRLTYDELDEYAQWVLQKQKEDHPFQL